MRRMSLFAGLLSLVSMPGLAVGAEPVSASHWEASLQVGDGITRARLSLGYRGDATNGFDANHEVGLMAGSGVQAYFDRPTWPQQRYVRDIRGTGFPATWTVTVEPTTAGTPMEVTWDLRFVPFGCERIDLSLADPSAGSSTDLRRAGRYTWISDGAARTLRVEATLSAGPAPARPQMISAVQSSASNEVVLRWAPPPAGGVAVGGYDLFRTVNGEVQKLNELPIDSQRFNDRLALPDEALVTYSVRALSYELCAGPPSEPRTLHRVGQPTTSTPSLPSTPSLQP